MEHRHRASCRNSDTERVQVPLGLRVPSLQGAGDRDESANDDALWARRGGPDPAQAQQGRTVSLTRHPVIGMELSLTPMIYIVGMSAALTAL